MLTEADTCRVYVTKGLYAAGWSDDQIVEQYFFTDGRVLVTGGYERRGRRKFADYLLRYRRDFSLAVVEAKAAYKLPGDGLEQAKDYAAILGLPFAYATNGLGIVEFDRRTGLTTEFVAFPSPKELWQRYRADYHLESDDAVRPLLTPDYLAESKRPRYYQRIAINRAVEAIAKGRPRVLLTMATGTGKTTVAFQICWKLFEARWNRTGEHRRPRMLYLADRTVLVDDPMAKDFAPFGDARSRIESANVSQGRSMYFATYQAMAGDGSGTPLYRAFAPDFFDLVVVDECHRGSAHDESDWRDILTHFAPAAQLGMTATPLRLDNRDTYRYFRDPLYVYSLKQGIEDGFLAPYRVHRVVTNWDATGWRPTEDDLDRYGREIPDEEYGTPEFERKVALRERTSAIAAHLTDYLQQTDPMAKTIVFCVDQEHALEMARQLANGAPDLMRQHPDYVARVTADEGEVGKGHLAHFQDIERRTPVILTTSQLLTTGVDAPTCKNVVLARVVGSIVEFKQIIGRGTRLREDYGKLSFNIIDYTGSATRHFADADFDGYPVIEDVIEIDEAGKVVGEQTVIDNTGLDEGELGGQDGTGVREGGNGLADQGDGDGLPRKFYFDGGYVTIVAHQVLELDPDGHLLRTVAFTDYTGEKVRTLFPSATDLRAAWIDAGRRDEMLAMLEERGLTPELIAEKTGHPEADTFDLLCHLAFNTPLLTRSLNTIDIQPETTYRQVTVRLHHRGVVLRGAVLGSEIRSTRQYLACAGQLILSRIDARNGAIGLVPPELDGAVVTNDFWLFDIDESRVVPKYLDYYVGTADFIDLCKRASEGTTNRVRLQPDQFLALPMPLPSLAEQRRIVARVEELAGKIEEARGLRRRVEDAQKQLLATVFAALIEQAGWLPMSDAAPLVRRPVDVDPFGHYSELGVRSFGKGTFHKPSLSGAEIGSKRVYWIHPGDLVFNNVFAWEGAVAVATPADEGRIGSHRFITCVPKQGVTTPEFLRFHFLTPLGLQQLGEASPGGAGRNRTLGLQALANIAVPVVDYERQCWFNELQKRFLAADRIRDKARNELDALLPAVLERAFRGEL